MVLLRIILTSLSLSWSFTYYINIPITVMVLLRIILTSLSLSILLVILHVILHAILWMRIPLLCIHKRISCVYTRDLLCMRNTLVHALGQGPQGPGTQKRRGPGPGTGPAPYCATIGYYCATIGHNCATIGDYCATIAPLLRHYRATIAPLLATISPLLRHYWRLFGAVAAEMNLPWVVS